MICGAVFMGAVQLTCGLVAIGTGKVPTRPQRKGLLRDEHPLQFWVMVVGTIAIGLAFIVYGCVGSIPHR